MTGGVEKPSCRGTKLAGMFRERAEQEEEPKTSGAALSLESWITSISFSGKTQNY